MTLKKIKKINKMNYFYIFIKIHNIYIYKYINNILLIRKFFIKNNFLEK